jgi:hypothetical protein
LAKENDKDEVADNDGEIQEMNAKHGEGVELN